MPPSLIGDLHVHSQCYRVLHSVTQCHAVLHDVTHCHRVLHSATQCFRVFLQCYTLFTPPSGRGLVIPIFFLWFFFFFFLVVTYPRPPAFAWPNKYSSCLSPHRQGLLS